MIPCCRIPQEMFLMSHIGNDHIYNHEVYVLNVNPSKSQATESDRQPDYIYGSFLGFCFPIIS